ncbi:Spermatogenesis-defective protein 39-like [Acipenser ruthenus]|uniref:Spermatogenesis-defective protein 39 homolog n=1 Tax=Acipenser ruthenus TaxID=7906 RepID=A0A444UT24_ACIRT|nr:Spermatogenesis-defective protein 39-like [Acipenser ruthenus]
MLRNKPDEDDYWNSSKFNAFTFDDDDEFSQCKKKKIKKNKHLPSYFYFKATNDPSLRSFAPELRKPKSEYKDYISDWSPEDTVRRMQKGKPYSLESFRSLKDKLLLLDEAVQIHDGNVITAVKILFRELVSRQIALQHFIHFLKEAGEQKLLLELLKTLGRTEDMALLQYSEHLNIKDEVQRKDFLKGCISPGFLVSLPFSVDDASHVQDHYTLLERQIIVEGTYSSPANIKKTFKISDKQYLLAALGARAKLKAWKDVDTLFTTKNWLGYTKKKTPIGFHRVADILHKNNAPVQVLQEYVCLVDDTDLKLNLASKYKCHDVIIDVSTDLLSKLSFTGTLFLRVVHATKTKEKTKL